MSFIFRAKVPEIENVTGLFTAESVEVTEGPRGGFNVDVMTGDVSVPTVRVAQEVPEISAQRVRDALDKLSEVKEAGHIQINIVNLYNHHGGNRLEAIANDPDETEAFVREHFPSAAPLPGLDEM